MRISPYLETGVMALAGMIRSAEDQGKVDLGQHLYYEKRLSNNDKSACNSCHLLNKNGEDGRISRGAEPERARSLRNREKRRIKDVFQGAKPEEHCENRPLFYQFHRKNIR